MGNAIVKISKEAKRIRRIHPSLTWRQAIKKASQRYNAGSLSGTAKKFRQTGSSNKAADVNRSARPPGARIPAGGKKVTYYERRKNRSDVPGKLTGTNQNDLVLRNLAQANMNLKHSDHRLHGLKQLLKIRSMPKIDKNKIRSRVKDEGRYRATMKKEISMLKALLK